MSTDKSIGWVSVSQSDLNKPESTQRNGIQIQFLLSPTDVPVAWRAYQDKSSSNYIIEFKYYASTEPMHDVAQEQGVTLQVGKNTKRVYKIILNPHAVCGDKEEVEVEIKLGILASNLAHEPSNLRKGNADAISRLLQPFVTGREHMFGKHAHSG